MVAQYAGWPEGFLNGHLITKVAVWFYIADTKFQPIGELGALNHLDVDSIKVSTDGSAAYLISKTKAPAGVSAKADTYSLGRFGDDGKLLWRTPVGRSPRILYADGNTVLLEEDQVPSSPANGYSAKDGKLRYKIHLDKSVDGGATPWLAGGRVPPIS